MPASLYYTPTSCGGASFIAAHKAGLIASGAVVAHKVDIGKHVITATGADFCCAVALHAAMTRAAAIEWRNRGGSKRGTRGR